MPSLIYTSFFNDLNTNTVNPTTDTIKVMLVSGYTPAKTHAKRSDLGATEITGTGYTAGGNTVAPTSAVSGTAINLTLPGTTWPTSTISATHAVYYKARGGAATADELIAVNEFGSTVASTAGTFTLNASTLTINN